MKKITFLFSLLFSVLIATSCDPIEDRDSAGGVLSPDELNIETYGLVEGGNKIVMKNSTPGVGSFWDYGSGTSARQQDTILVPFLGDIPIQFIGSSAGGSVKKTQTVKVDRIEFPVDETWNLLAGYDANGKTWMWDFEDPNDAVFGNGAALVDVGPSWARNSAQSMDTNDPLVGMNGTMVFDLNMRANFTKRNGNGEAVETSSFSFDMSKKILSADGVTDWSIGQLTIPDSSVMHGISPNAEGRPIVHTYEILKLTEDEMVLAIISPNGWESWYWKFKVKR